MLYGPVHSERAVELFEKGVEDAQKQGGTIVYGGKVGDAMPSSFDKHTAHNSSIRLGKSNKNILQNGSLERSPLEQP